VVDKTLEIVGDGPLTEIEIRARGANVPLFQANIRAWRSRPAPTPPCAATGSTVTLTGR